MPTLESLGLAEAPRDHPLTYPGAWPRESGILDGDRYLPLPAGPPPDFAGLFPDRVPVLAVGSNACPGQLRHKMAEFGIREPIPMTLVRITGIEVGVSAHVSRLGYVSASPFNAPGTVRELFVTWVDAAQLAVIDASEGVTVPTGPYDRAWLSSPEVDVELESGERLFGVYAYVNRRGVLHDGSGSPRRHPGEHRLLTELLGGSPGLRDLFGLTPEEFCARARFDRDRCDRGTRLFAAEGLVVASGLEPYVLEPRALETHVPETHVPETHVPDTHVPGPHLPDQQTGSPGTGASLSPPLR
ncbi:hypothetical protein [Streptomyces graminilatus]|uniref:hypothetical protein n=1 Tax=Streptomyces graminilatus TaxID=1464070 RepID=UPI0007C82C36|nr:hypothetical protein [Streptomyces graminilatus]